MCKATEKAQNRERQAQDDDNRFLESKNKHRSITFKGSALQFKLARKRHPSKLSQKILDDLYGPIAPSLTLRKIGRCTSVISEPGKFDITVRNNNIDKSGTPDEQNTLTKCD